MASSSNRRTLALFHLLLLACSTAHGQLMSNYYFDSCLPVENYVRDEMNKALGKDRRMGASILRLFFHDCFVNGCDASVLLDDTETMLGEKNALPNKKSLRGYELIDTIKARLEASCRATVSCADILALAARDAVLLLGGPYWDVPLGRKDARTASQSAANANVPPPFENLPNLISLFASKGLDARDLTALSGAHTIGQARCINFRGHVYDDRNVNASFAALRKGACPTCGSGDDNLAPLDLQTPLFFDNNYYKNLVVRQGLLHSDQELFNGGSQDSLVLTYSNDGPLFARDFAAAMVKMGNISPLTGGAGEIRLNCRRVN